MATEYTGEVVPVGGKEYTGEVVSEPKRSATDDFLRVPRAAADYLYGPVEAATTLASGAVAGGLGSLYSAAKHYGEQPGRVLEKARLLLKKKRKRFSKNTLINLKQELGNNWLALLEEARRRWKAQRFRKQFQALLKNWVQFLSLQSPLLNTLLPQLGL